MDGWPRTSSLELRVRVRFVGGLFIDVTLRDIDLHNAHLGICLRVTIKFEFAFSYLYCAFNWMFD